MADRKRILFIAGEVAPFATIHATAHLVRTLPELLQEAGDYELRVMMPRYGVISERRNRLHEVIRLSGIDISMGSASHTLKVKVASIPGIRLQVYFMDNAHYFKRKGVYADKQGTAFEDNAERALFFGKATLETIRKLGWKPDVVHAVGAMSGFVPLLLGTTYATDAIFGDAKVVYTPDGVDLVASEDLVAALGLPSDAAGQTLDKVGLAHAGAAIYPAHLPPNGTQQFAAEPSDTLAQAVALYDEILNEVPA